MKVSRTSTRRTGSAGGYGIRTRSSAGYPRQAQAVYRREAAQVSNHREPRAGGSGRQAVRRPSVRRKPFKRLLFVGAVCVVATVAVFAAIATKPKAVVPVSTPAPVDPDKLAQGIRINGKDVSGQSIDTVRRQLEAELQKEVNAIDVTVTFGEKSLQLSGMDLNPTSNLDEVLEQVALLSQAETEEQADAAGRDFTVETKLDIQALKERLNGFAKEVNQPGRDAMPLFNHLKGKFADLERPTREEVEKMFSITPEKPGFTADVDATAQKVLEAVRENPKCTVELVATQFEPKLTAEMLKESFQFFSQYSTYVSRAKTNTPERVKNIERAVSLLTGTTILPGQEFSFNQTVGPRTEANGFYMARTISGGKYVDDFGGGTCQVSTTLYIAALRAGVKITERHKHTFPSGYAQNGLDATVAYGTKDLKFVNTSDLPIYIYATYTGETGYSSTSRKIHVLILGKPLPDGLYYDLVSVELAKGEMPDYDIQIAKNGEWGLVYSDEEYIELPAHRRYEVATYRQLFQDDGDGVQDPDDGATERVGPTYDMPAGERELLFIDTYKENRGIKWIGAKERPPGLFQPTEPTE